VLPGAVCCFGVSLRPDVFNTVPITVVRAHYVKLENIQPLILRNWQSSNYQFMIQISEAAQQHNKPTRCPSCTTSAHNLTRWIRENRSLPLQTCRENLGVSVQVLTLEFPTYILHESVQSNERANYKLKRLVQATRQQNSIPLFIKLSVQKLGSGTSGQIETEAVYMIFCLVFC
jgi:hypothetical protein